MRLRAIWKDIHLGSFGKLSQELVFFIEALKDRYNNPLDPVYTGKVMLTNFSALKEMNSKTAVT